MEFSKNTFSTPLRQTRSPLWIKRGYRARGVAIIKNSLPMLRGNHFFCAPHAAWEAKLHFLQHLPCDTACFCRDVNWQGRFKRIKPPLSSTPLCEKGTVDREVSQKSRIRFPRLAGATILFDRHAAWEAKFVFFQHLLCDTAGFYRYVKWRCRLQKLNYPS